MDNESEQGLKKTASRWSTARYHVYSFRYLLGLMAIGTLQSTISPSVPYIENTFFAEKYGGDDCEAHPSSDPCRKGATDAAQIGSFTDAAAHAAAMFMAVCLGSYSDSLGRRPMLRAYGAAVLVPTLALALHVCGGVTLWLYLILKTAVEAFDINGVYLAMMSDIIEDPQERAAAFGTFMAVVMVLFVAGMPLGYVIPRGVALAISVAAGMAKLAYLFVIFPETSRKATQQQSPVQKNLLQTMVSACSLLSKNAFAKRLACVLVCSGIGSAGYGVALPPFMMGYLGYTRSNKLVLMCIAALSALVAFGVLLGPLVKVLGQVRTLQLCLAASAAVPLLTAVCQDQWQLGVLTPILVFPIVMSIPLVSALKSAVVSSRDQGLVQGAVASMTKGAATAGSLIFGSVFAATTGGGKANSAGSVLPCFALVACIYALAAGIACTLPTVPPPASDSADAAEVELAGRPDVMSF